MLPNFFNKTKFFFIFGIFILLTINSFADPITIALVQYPQGDDWYSCRTAMGNFLENLVERTELDINTDFPEILLDQDDIYNYPIMLINGHGRINLNELSVERLRQYLISGGFLIVNDDYGLYPAFTELSEDLFPNAELTELPDSHPIFSSYYNFPDGCPKIHEHDGLPATCFGIFHDQRMVILYIYNSDIVDGWEPEQVYHDPPEIREAAIRFGINIIYYILSQ